MEQTKKRRMSCMLMATLLVAQLLPLTAEAGNRIVLLGFAGPISGLSGASGTSMLNAARMAVDDINSAGLRVGDDTLALRLLVQDDRSNPRIAEVAARNLVHSGVAGVVGIFNSAVAISSSDVYQKAGVPHIAVAGVRRFTQQGYGTAFRMAAYDEQRAQVLASFTVNELHKRRAVIIHDDSVFGRGYQERFESAFARQGGAVVGVHAVSASAHDFQRILQSVGDVHADLIFFGGLGAQSVVLAQSMQRMGVKATLVTAASLVGPVFLQSAGQAAEGVVSVMPGALSNGSGPLDTFEKKYQLRYHVAAGPYSAVAYDQVQALAAAIMRAGSANPRKVALALHTVRYKGLTGIISFDGHGDLRDTSFSLYQVRNHTWIFCKQYSVNAGG